ncbi:hypothetical protein TRFO_27630 [Tritrichomonas foetus]|uniref:Uncharacterized protein n=1 Tax=Tritrichomonas foetus TaxID=1144522 RepID=A0A1J4K540_9EUKA|nr:hypothetical protein TRFO_27630 [Tritrichomonas foetus]|eukprot:OHT04836.1 hypothetical protein TRFO_27630 [Tritrichomonas foetus]
MENTPPPDLIDFAKKLLQDSVIGSNLQTLHDSLTEDFKEKLTISELGRRLAEMEEHHGMFTRISDSTPPIPNPEFPGFWTIDISMYIKNNEWFAHLSINNDHKINDFNFSRKPFFIPAEYFNPHKVIDTKVNDLPEIHYIKPTKRKTNKLPIGVFIHAAVQMDIDGHFGLRYPFRDLDFMAQHKVGLIKNTYENYGEPDPIVAITSHSIHSAKKISECGNVFLILHGFASLFLPQLVEKHGDDLSGVVLLNPSWEAVPGSGLESMTIEKVPHKLPILIIGCGNDQVLIKDHFEMWKKAAPEAESGWFEHCDHFMMDAKQIPQESDYMKTEGHVNEKLMRNVITWIRSHSTEE